MYEESKTKQNKYKNKKKINKINVDINSSDCECLFVKDCRNNKCKKAVVNSVVDDVKIVLKKYNVDKVKMFNVCNDSLYLYINVRKNACFHVSKEELNVKYRNISKEFLHTRKYNSRLYLIDETGWFNPQVGFSSLMNIFKKAGSVIDKIKSVFSFLKDTMTELPGNMQKFFSLDWSRIAELVVDIYFSATTALSGGLHGLLQFLYHLYKGFRYCVMNFGGVNVDGGTWSVREGNEPLDGEFQPQSFSLEALMAAFSVLGLSKEFIAKCKDFALMTGVKVHASHSFSMFFVKMREIILYLLDSILALPLVSELSGFFEPIRRIIDYCFSPFLCYQAINEVVEVYTQYVKQPSLLHDPFYRERVMDVYVRNNENVDFLEYVSNHDNRHFRETWRAFSEDLVKFVETYGSSSRVEPICIVFDGEPNSGKSVLMNTFVEYFKKINMSVYTHVVPSIEASKDFYDDYMNQDVFVMDDVGQQGKSQWRTIINFVSPVKYPLDCAQAEKKNTKFFNSKVILCTTNNFENLQGFTAKDAISTPSALFRRVHLVKVEKQIMEGEAYTRLTYRKFNEATQSWVGHFVGHDSVATKYSEVIKNGRKIKFELTNIAKQNQLKVSIAWLAVLYKHLVETQRLKLTEISAIDVDDVDDWIENDLSGTFDHFNTNAWQFQYFPAIFDRLRAMQGGWTSVNNGYNIFEEFLQYVTDFFSKIGKSVLSALVALVVTPCLKAVRTLLQAYDQGACATVCSCLDFVIAWFDSESEPMEVFDTEECPICKEVLVAGQKVMRTVCGHLMCEQCCTTWRELVVTVRDRQDLFEDMPQDPEGGVPCPVCRTDIEANFDVEMGTYQRQGGVTTFTSDRMANALVDLGIYVKRKLAPIFRYAWIFGRRLKMVLEYCCSSVAYARRRPWFACALVCKIALAMQAFQILVPWLLIIAGTFWVSLMKLFGFKDMTSQGKSKSWYEWLFGGDFCHSTARNFEKASKKYTQQEQLGPVAIKFRKRHSRIIVDTVTGVHTCVIVSGSRFLTNSHVKPDGMIVDVYQTYDHYAQGHKEMESVKVQLIKDYPISDICVCEFLDTVPLYRKYTKFGALNNNGMAANAFVSPYGIIPLLPGANVYINDKPISYSYQADKQYTIKHEPGAGFVYDIEGAGLCGSALLSFDGRVLGTHVVGNGDQGFAYVFPAWINEELNELMGNGSGTKRDFETRSEVIPGMSGVRLSYGNDEKWRTCGQHKTSLEPSRLHVSVNESTKILYEDLREMMEDGSVSKVEIGYKQPAFAGHNKTETHETIKELAKKSLMHQGVVTTQELDFVEKCILAILPPSFKDLSEEETSFGNEELKPINKKSSNGFACLPEKSDYLDYENRQLTVEGRRVIDRFREDARRRIYDEDDFVCKETIKDELRVESKVNQPRLFRVMPFPHIWWTKRICGELVAWFKKHVHEFGICIGLDPYNDFDIIVRRMLECEYIGDADFKNWDGRLLALIMLTIKRALKKRYVGNFEDVLDYVFVTIARSWTLVCDELLATTHGLPSGTWVTLLLNCLVNKALTAITMYRQDNNVTVEDVLKIIDYVCGDDKWFASNDSRYTMLTVARVATDLGMKVTTGDKKEVTSASTPLAETSFLKRKVVYHPFLKKFVGALSMDTLVNTVQWFNTGSTEFVTYDELMIAKANAVLVEAYLHSRRCFFRFKEYFNSNNIVGTFDLCHVENLLRTPEGYSQVLRMLEKDFLY